MAIPTLRLITNDTYSLLYRYYTTIYSIVPKLSLLYSFTFNNAIQELSVMTRTGSFLLKSTGFNIGDCIAITLMLWKHLSSRGVHWKVQLFCADPDNGVVYTVIYGMYSARYCPSPRNFWTSV